MITLKELKAMRERCEEVTRSSFNSPPWKYDEVDGSLWDNSGDSLLNKTTAEMRPYLEPEVGRFVAAAITDLPRLLDEIEELQVNNIRIETIAKSHMKRADRYRDEKEALESLLKEAADLARKVELLRLCACWNDNKCSGCQAEAFLSSLKKLREGGE
jgi:hypothetical protein